MDERSPRQPDSSGPPEDPDETPARAPRPENPYRIPQRPQQGAPPTGAPAFGNGNVHGWNAPAAGRSGDSEWNGAPEGMRSSWEASRPGGSEEPAREAPQERPAASSWDTPGDTPSGGAWDSPGAGEAPTAWEGSASGAHGNAWDASRGENPSAPAWDAPRHEEAPGHPGSWDTPYPSVHGPSGGWDDPSDRAAEDGSPPPAHDSWQDAPQGDPDPQGWGPSPVGAEAPAARDESWDRDGSWDEEPYRGEPVHHGDTPYPGGAPLPGEASGDPAAPEPPPGQGQGFEYLYSGGGAAPGGPDGPDDGGYGGDGGYRDDGGYGDYGDDEGYEPAPQRKSRRGLVIGVVSVVVVLLLVGGAASWYVLTLPQPEEATAEYEAAWEAQDYERLAAVTTGGDAATVLSGIDSGLGLESIDVEVGAPDTDGGSGSAPYEVTVELTNAGGWGWEGELPLVREDGQWWVDFAPEVAYPGLGEGQVLVRTAVWGERGRILAADGTRLDTPDVSGSLQMIAGSLGEATEEDVERLGPAYEVGDTVGMGGLQRTYEERLAGEAATTILMVDAAEAEDTGSLEATEENTVATLDGSDGEDITTSIDMSVQNAASNAVIGSTDPAGMVALRPSTGEILAAVNVPGGFNRAFEGQYPPGSSFKIITYSALLDNGMSMDTPMNCPEEYDLGGWPFVNAGGAEYGAQSVTEAFATSCNTSLVEQVGERLSPETLQASAEQFGMNAPLDIGVPAFEPTFPPVDSSTMLGAQSIGQGQILTSPLHMATVPAAVADGSWRHPVLVSEPAPEGLPEPRPVAQAEALRTMMRAVVTDGTAKDLPFQGEVYGKTGTAEYGTAEDADENDELPSHAWMVGFKGDVAFAVVVEGGGGGSSVAGPLAVKFANAL